MKQFLVFGGGLKFTPLLFWVGYFLLLVFVFSQGFSLEASVLRAIALMAPQVALVYINVGLLIPLFFAKRKYIYYLVGVLAAFTLVFIVYWLLHRLWLEPPPFEELHHRRPPPEMMRRPPRRFHIDRGMFIDMGLSILLFTFSLTFYASRTADRSEREAAELRNENLNSELKFLRAQINPHFLFNSLHTIYSMAMLRREKTPDMIVKLSDMLRYMLYEVNEGKVPLQKEIQYIEDYISFIKLKDDSINHIDVDMEVQEEVMIEPMLFIPLVENSFKYSQAESQPDAWINLTLRTEKDTLYFLLSNSVASQVAEEGSGIGLENVKRRLELLYPGHHQLKISQKKQVFSVDLTIQLA